MQVSLHELKHQVDILAVLGPDDLLQLDDIIVVQLRKDGDFPVGALRIHIILEGVEYLLEGEVLAGGQVGSLPNVTVGSTAEVGSRVVDLENMWFDFLAHCYSNRNMEYQCPFLLLLLLQES